MSLGITLPDPGVQRARARLGLVPTLARDPRERPLVTAASRRCPGRAILDAAQTSGGRLVALAGAGEVFETQLLVFHDLHAAPHVVPLLASRYDVLHVDARRERALVAGCGLLYEVPLDGLVARCLGMTRAVRGLAYLGDDRIAVLTSDTLMILERAGAGFARVAALAVECESLVAFRDGRFLATTTATGSVWLFGMIGGDLRPLGRVGLKKRKVFVGAADGALLVSDGEVTYEVLGIDEAYEDACE